jgi:hypothetical protein
MLSLVSVLISLLATTSDGRESGRPEAPPAGHSSRGLVIVLRPADVDELTRTALARVTGELTAAEFQTAFVTLDPLADPTTQVETVAPESHAVAAFAITHFGEPDGRTIAIWVSDRVGRRTNIVRMAMKGDDISQDAAILALNAIELIRASLGGLWPTPPPQVVAPVAPPPPAPQGPQVTIGLGVSALQDVGLQWMGSLMAMVTWPRGLGIKVELDGLGPSLKLNGDDGTATVHRQNATLGLAWTFLRRARVQSFIVGSAGVAHLNGEGATNDPAHAVPRSGAVWSALLAAGLAARVRIVSKVWIGAELDCIATLPPLVIRITDSETRSFSRPGVQANAGLQFTF